jgi:adenylyltransferase/sulfurtransferase
MSGNRLHRDARHHALAQVGEAGQARIAAGSALVVGVGGIGCASAAYLTSAGVGTLTLCDFDSVDETNLGRQILFGPDDVGDLKAAVAARRLSQQNPDVRVTALNGRLSDDDLLKWARQVDVVLDGTDNFATRFQVNDACVQVGGCLVSGSAIRLEGQLARFGPDYSTSPCYRCLYEDADESLTDCAGNGVFAPVPGVIGTMMAVEALKFLVGINSAPGALRLYDAADGTWQSIRIGKREACPSCGARK